MAPDNVPPPRENETAVPSAATGQPRRRGLSLGLFVLGLAALSYLLGAAVMFFQLPTSSFLGKAFLGGRAWNERRQLPAQAPEGEPAPVITGVVDRPGQTFDGFTLYTQATLSARSTQAFLINMRREVVHRWAINFSDVWPQPPHIRGRVNDDQVCFFACQLYPNGDLLVVFHGLNNYANGYGLAKLDKDSRVLWRYSANIHHDVDVGEDGTIYAIKHENVYETPKGFEAVPPPWLVDYLVVLTHEGKEVRKPIALVEAIRNSPYQPLLSPLETPRLNRGLTLPRMDEVHERQDVLHTNFVKELRRPLAAHFPLFKAGQVLLSLRNLDALAVLDPTSGAVVWAARGPWRAQHDSQFLDNGHLLIFDNLGSPRGSRVLEYDPQTQAFPWTYSGEHRGPFFTKERGMSQRLPNGNTLVVVSERGEILEVTRDKEVAWSCSMNAFIATARRYAPGQLHFLKGGQRARP